MSQQQDEVARFEDAPARAAPSLPAGWPAVLQPPARAALEQALLAYVTPRRWFRAKNRRARAARIVDLIPLSERASRARDVLALLDVSFDSGAPERYLVPLAALAAGEADRLAARAPHALIARLAAHAGEEVALVDGLATGSAAEAFLQLVGSGATRNGEAGTLVGRAEPALAEDAAWVRPEPARVAPLEQTNSTVSFGERLLLKIYRQLTPGINPELEMGTFLDAHAAEETQPTPAVLGSLAYRGRDGAAYGVGIMHAFVHSDGDAWSAVERELREGLARCEGAPPDAAGPGSALGRFAARAGTLGRRTAEIHLALASASPDDEAVRPEPLTKEDRRVASRRATAMLEQHLAALRIRQNSLSADAQAATARLAERDGTVRRAIAGTLARFVEVEPGVMKTRIHGDLHLGQVLARGDDFTIIDFEGEPARPLAERRAKSSPLRDVMGMVRSFSYAPEAVLRAAPADPARRARLLPAARRWQSQVTDEYLRGYLAAARAAPFLPRDRGHLRLMLDFYALERVIYEVGYELNNRTDWVDIPLAGLLALAKEGAP